MKHRKKRRDVDVVVQDASGERLSPSEALQRADAYLVAGEHGKALQLFNGVLDISPAMMVAHLGRIDVALAERNPAKALRLCDVALSFWPNAPRVSKRRDQARAPGPVRDGAPPARQTPRQRGNTAANYFETQDRPPGNPKPPVPPGIGDLLRRAAGARQTGNHEEATALYDRCLQLDPSQSQAHMGRIGVALELQNGKEALRLCDAAIRTDPNNLLFRIRRADALRQTGGFDRAREILQRIRPRAERTPAALFPLGQSLAAAGDAGGAVRCFETLLDLEPGNGNAAFALVNLLQDKDDLTRARENLDRVSHANPSGTGGVGARAQALRLEVKQLELRYAHDRDTAAKMSVEDSTTALALAPQLPQPDQIRLARLAMATRNSDLMAAIVSALADWPVLQIPTAIFLVRCALMSGQRELVTRLAEALADRVPASKRGIYQIEAILLLDGPARAKAALRTVIPGPRNATEAALVGKVLHGASEFGLAFRYLRLCLARWPASPALRNMAFQSVCSWGQLDQARQLIAWIADHDPAASTDDLQLRLWGETGDHAAVLAAIQRRGHLDLNAASLTLKLKAHLALGQVEAAKDMIPQYVSSGALGEASAARFRLSHMGSMLNELTLYRTFNVSDGGDDAAALHETPSLAQDYFYPAKCVIDGWLAGEDGSDADRTDRPRSTVPPQVMQYWNTPDIPSEVREVMGTWKTGSDGRYELFDRPGALRFLAGEYDETHLRAFQLANNVAEECDFFRLCYLYKRGGIYADADDRLMGRIGAFLSEGPGLIVFREQMGCLANNVICSPAGHPALRIAIDLARPALLNCESDNTWIKTGPGLLTRAVATYQQRTPDPEARMNLSVRSSMTMRHHVGPHVKFAYKFTAGYWDKKTSEAPRGLTKALETFLPQTDA